MTGLEHLLICKSGGDPVVQGEHVVEVLWLTRAEDLVNQDNSVMYSKLVNT